MRRRILLVAGVLLACVLGVQTVAGAVAISPATLTAKDVLRGSQLDRSLTIFNTEQEPKTFRFQPGGKAIADWISVVDNKTGAELETITVPAKSSASVKVIVNVPKTAANGTYKGELASVPVLKPNGPTMVLVPTLKVSVGVVDHEIIKLSLRNLTVNDVEANTPLDINVIASNESNVDAEPQVEFGVVQGEEILRQAEFQMKGITAGDMSGDVFNLGIKGLKEGDYRAYCSLRYHGEASERLWTDFKVVPPGTFTKASMERFRVSGPRVVGGTLRVRARFSSKSPRELQPKFMADVYLDGLKIGTLQGKRARVEPYREVEWVMPYKLKRAGEYRVEGYFVYSGKESNHRSVSFDARGYEVLAYGFAGIVACVWGVRTYRRRRSYKRLGV